MKPRYLLLLVLTAAFAAWGFSTPSAEANEAAGLDACALLTQEDAEALLGEPAQEGQRLMDRFEEGVAEVSLCLYSAAADDSHKSVGLMARRSLLARNTNTPAHIERARAAARETAGSEPEALDGVDDTAFWTASGEGRSRSLQLQAFSGNGLYLITDAHGFGDDAAALEAAKAVALKALERLRPNGG